jgi:hypothetical protein
LWIGRLLYPAWEGIGQEAGVGEMEVGTLERCAWWDVKARIVFIFALSVNVKREGVVYSFVSWPQNEYKILPNSKG